MMRICFICHEYPPFPHGGIGTFVQVLGRALVQMGHKVRVAGLYPSNFQVAAREDDHGVEVFRLRESPNDWGGMRARMKLFSLIGRWARRGEIDLIEVPDAQGWAAFWPKMRVPVITRVHGSATYFARVLEKKWTRDRKIMDWLERKAIRRSDFWCSVSQYAADRTAEIFDLAPPTAISRVPIAVPPEIDFAQRDPGRVMYTGTLTPKKGIISLVRAWPSVRHRCPRAELHIYGKGDAAMQCMLMRELDGDSRSSVQFHGHTARPEVLRQLQQARVAVFPSYAEAFAFAPLEAMVTGCPTVYSTRTSGPEAMEHEKEGLLVDPDNIPELANSLIRILTDDCLAAEMGRAGRERVIRDFSIERVTKDIERYYRERLIRFHGVVRARKVA